MVHRASSRTLAVVSAHTTIYGCTAVRLQRLQTPACRVSHRVTGHRHGATVPSRGRPRPRDARRPALIWKKNAKSAALNCAFFKCFTTAVSPGAVYKVITVQSSSSSSSPSTPRVSSRCSASSSSSPSISQSLARLRPTISSSRRKLATGAPPTPPPSAAR